MDDVAQVSNFTTLRCVNCDTMMTREENKRQYRRLTKRGMSRDEAKSFLPRCKKCVTFFIEAQNVVGSAEFDRYQMEKLRKREKRNFKNREDLDDAAIIEKYTSLSNQQASEKLLERLRTYHPEHDK